MDRVQAALARYDEREPVLRAFAWLDRDRALRLAAEADRSVGGGALHGEPVGVKDIFDTAGIPTERGSALYAGRVPQTSAAVVTNLERAGAIVVGKTVTAELAYYSPGPTTNPYDATRTPGGSSMGSAAAVAAGIVRAAVGSQTNGSVIRPAAFCGVIGFKPTYGRLSVDGVFAFAPTLDHVGALAASVEDAARLTAAMAGEDPAQWWIGPTGRTPRLAAIRTSDWDLAEDAMQRRFQADIDALALAGAPIEWPELPDGLDDGAAVLRTIMAYESARTIAPDVARRPDVVSTVARELFAEGERVTNGAYRDALLERDRLRGAYREWMNAYDAILTPPARGEAPTKDTTGDPRFCSRWTLLGAPAVTIPTGLGAAGLPLGLQLVGRIGDDAALLSVAAWAERRVADTRPASE